MNANALLSWNTHMLCYKTESRLQQNKFTLTTFSHNKQKQHNFKLPVGVILFKTNVAFLCFTKSFENVYLISGVIYLKLEVMFKWKKPGLYKKTQTKSYAFKRKHNHMISEKWKRNKTILAIRYFLCKLVIMIFSLNYYFLFWLSLQTLAKKIEMNA